MSEETGGWGALDALPGNPMIWILISSELVVFGGALIGFAGARIAEPEIFAASQASLDRLAGTLNTAVLLTSGWCAALAVVAGRQGRTGALRLRLAAAAAFGLVFLAVKIAEYAEKAEAGIGLETDTFFTLYYLITGFHAAHVVLGLGLLAIGAISTRTETIETAAAFWHMVDLVWVLIFPVIYLVR